MASFASSTRWWPPSSANRTSTRACGRIRALQDLHLTNLERVTLGELNEAAALASLDLGDHSIGHARRLRTIEHDADHARRPARRVPLELDRDERVAGKEGRLEHPLQAAASAARPVRYSATIADVLVLGPAGQDFATRRDRHSQSWGRDRQLSG